MGEGARANPRNASLLAPRTIAPLAGAPHAVAPLAGAPLVVALLAGAVFMGALVGCGKSATSTGSTESEPADYGDAPDGRPTGYPGSTGVGRFPSSAEHDGARATAPERLWLGASASLESGYADAKDPDGRANAEHDSDDGVLDMTLQAGSSPLGSSGPAATLTVRVSSEAEGARAFLNVLVDTNADGEWRGSGEWTVQNHQVDLEGTRTRPVQLPAFDYGSTSAIPARAWMRVLVSDAPVPNDWDGRGRFTAGEVEDHLVELASAAPLVGLDCINPASPSGNWSFGGARFVNVKCSITPFSTGAGGPARLRFTMQRKSGGVRHTGLCGDLPTELSESGKRVDGGPVELGSSSTSFQCLFDRNAPLPSEWEFSVPVGEAQSSISATGVRMGVRGALSSSFVMERGQCAHSCKSSADCVGDDVCTSGCCGSAWAEACTQSDPAACGRCCAITGGARASDCVRRACGL